MTLIQSLILIPVISNDQANTSENYANKEDTSRNNVKVLTKANEISSPVVSNYIKGDLIKLSDSNDGVWKGQFDYSGGVNPSTQVSILVSLYLKNQNKLL